MEKSYFGKTKEELKYDADSIAMLLGYHPNSMSLDVINVKDAYCRGFSKAAEEYDNIKEQNLKLAAQNKCLLEALKELVRDCTDNEDSFPVCPGITSTSKAKETIKKLSHG